MTHTASELQFIGDIVGPDNGLRATGVRFGVNNLSGKRLDEAQLVASETTHEIVVRAADSATLDHSCYIVIGGITYIVDAAPVDAYPTRAQRPGVWTEVYCHIINGGQPSATVPVTPAQTFKTYVDQQDAVTLQAAKDYADAHGGAAALVEAEAYTDTQVAAEATARAAADATEVTNRQNAVNAEVTARVNADTAESNARIAADALKEDKANKGAPNGYAPLDSSSKVPSANLPTAPVTSVNTKTGVVSLTTTDVPEGSNLYFTNGRASAAAPVQSVAGRTGAVVIAESDVTNLTTDLAAKQAISEKDQANGYAGLDSGGKLKVSEAPTWNQNTTGTAAGLSGTPALPNGTTATTQSAGDNSTKVATNAYVDRELSTAGIAGFFACPDVDGGGVPLTAGGWNGCFFGRFYISKPITITKASLNIGAVSTGTGKQLGVGIYPASAGSGVLASATFNVSTGQATGVRSATIAQGTVRLAQGWYYAVVTCNDSTVTLTYQQNPATAVLNIMNQNGTRFGTATVAVQGTPDSTLGTLTKGTGPAGMPLVFYEP